MVDTHSAQSLQSTLIPALHQLLDRQITTAQLVQFAETVYWELLEGRYSSDRSPQALHLRQILSDITAQWECRSPNSPAEFPTEWIDHWLTQLQSASMTHTPKNQPTFNITHQNGNINTGDITIQGDMIGTQHTHSSEQNFEVLLTNYKQFIDEVQQENPNLTDAAEITKTIDVEARRIDTRWQNFLNLKRLWNGGKKAAIKVGEHFVESNPWGKGAIAFLEGVSEDVK